MKTTLFIAFTLIICSCTNEFTVQKKNNESDKREGERIMDIYFDNILLDKENENLSLFGKEFYKVSSKEKLMKENEFIKNKLGKLLGKELKHWETAVVSGTSSNSEYLFIYEIKREKYNSVETFYLIKEALDSIKIHSYKIESEGLLTE
ncbi:hypothetical protein [Moheibacter sediminis]|uniref:Lipoprotein n=1 Tax=Moheibacter sediminis TaxID=1434700 RepID=A0A1W1ZKF3_9FLAO|nr:hypothetical protein [Moheibacter sediminis]SMC49025.1 hypothetical protein SAMN06296427_10339 [Moheibacter sediminis]